MNSYDMLDARDVVVYHLDTMINPANGLTAAEGRDRFARSMDAVTGRDPIGPPPEARLRNSSHTPSTRATVAAVSVP